MTKKVCKILVGNKCDFIDSKVNTYETRELANKYDAKFILTLALLLIIFKNSIRVVI